MFFCNFTICPLNRSLDLLKIPFLITLSTIPENMPFIYGTFQQTPQKQEQNNPIETAVFASKQSPGDWFARDERFRH